MRSTLIPLLLVVAACSSFDPLPPEEFENAGTFVPTRYAPPAVERLVYRLAWSGIPAGKAVLEFEQDGQNYRSTADMETTGLISLLYGVSFRGESVADSEDLLSRRWSYVSGDEEDGQKRVMVRFDPASGKVVAVIREEDGVDRLNLDLPEALDPLGTLYALRCSRLDDGATFKTTFFTSRNPYRAETLVMGRESVKVPAGEFDTVLVRTDLTRIKDGERPKEGSSLGIWVTDDEVHRPVRIDVDTTYGRISLLLTEYEAASSENEDSVPGTDSSFTR